jgi:hypothetical protein
MPFFERNSFVLRQLLQPGWVNRTKLSLTVCMIVSREPGQNVSGARVSSKLAVKSLKFQRSWSDTNRGIGL